MFSSFNAAMLFDFNCFALQFQLLCTFPEFKEDSTCSLGQGIRFLQLSHWQPANYDQIKSNGLFLYETIMYKCTD